MKKKLILNKFDIQKVFQEKKVFFETGISCFYLNVQNRNFVKVAFAVNKKIKVKAQKNLAKRQMKSILLFYWKQIQDFPLDLVFIAKQNYFDFSFEEKKLMFEKILSKLQKLFNSKELEK